MTPHDRETVFRISAARRLALALVGRVAPSGLRQSYLDDLDEAAARRAALDGPRAAGRWFWRQVGWALVVFARQRLQGAPAVAGKEPGVMSFDTFRQDLKFALRMLRRAPALSLAIVATAALGIGANTAVFSVVYGVLMRPLPYDQPEGLVTVWQDLRARGGPVDEWASPGNLVDWQAQRDVFSAVASIRGWRPTLTGEGDPEPLTGELVTQDYFDLLGAVPALGRTFRADEMLPSSPRVVMIGHALWQRRFGGDPAVIGRSLLLGGLPHEVVGVAPAGFRPIIVADASVWRPDRLDLVNPARGAVVLRVVARLQPGITPARASSALDVLARDLQTRHPESMTDVGFTVIPLHDRVAGPIRDGLLALWGSVLIVLLVGCVNIANLLLARASGRTREIAVRTALGAGRRHVIRQLMTESLVLAGIGGVAGIAVGIWLTRALVALAPAGTPLLDRVAVDPAVLAFAAVLTGLTGLLFGLAPALQTAGRQKVSALRESGRGAAGRGGQRARRVLIAAEIALALVLLVGGGLFLRSFLAAARTDLGFTPDRVLAGTVPVPPASYASPEARVAFLDRLLERVSALPGVESAATASVLPLDGGDSDMNFLIEGAPPPPPGGQHPVTWYRLVSDRYFQTLGIRIAGGRGFEGREPAPVVVINDVLAARYWPNGDAIGRRVRFAPSDDAPWFTVIGIVEDVKQGGARADARGQTFIPYWHFPEEAGTSSVVLRVAGSPEALARPLREAVRELDPDIPVIGVSPMAARVADSVAQPRFLATIVVVFASLALLLAAVGVYGVMAFAVTQREPEIGVRLALGATRGQVFRLMFVDGVRLAAIGLAAGLALALVLAPAVGSLLFGVAPADPLTLGATSLTLLLAAALASSLPARRAMTMDPADVLRES